MAEDNLEPLVTQCPNCDTRFRVTEAQLQIAAGRVRCGACLSVFDGTQHLSVDGESLAAEDTPDVDALLEELDEVRSREPEVAPAMPVIDEDELIPVSAADLAEADDAEQALPEELLALEAELMQELRGDGPIENAQTTLDDELAEPLEEPFEIEVPEAVQDELSATDAAAEAVDEAPPDADLEPQPETEEEQQAPPQRVQAETADVVEPAQPDSDVTNPQADQAADAAADEPSEWLDEVAQDVWAEDEDEQGKVAETAAQAAQHGPDQAALGPAAAAAGTQAPARDLGEVIELQALPGTPMEDDPPGTDSASPALEADGSPPLFDLDEEEAAPRRRSWITLGFALLALFALPAQVLWFQYEAWVMNADYRPIYQTLCNITGCELPPMRDVSKIVSKRSFIRTHPDRADARIVDVLMVNNADFAQPYPLIELMATSLRGQLVAGRRFRPEEYLQGEAKASDLLPPRTPVHVSLEIADPAQEALNFEVTFR